MCLYTNRQLIEEFKAKHKDEEQIKCFKVLHAIQGRPPRSIFFNYYWLDGINKATSIPVLNDASAYTSASAYASVKMFEFVVENGIHVFTTHEAASRFLNSYVGAIQCRYMIVELSCRLDKFIGYGTSQIFSHLSPMNEAVFSEVELSKKEWDRINHVPSNK